MENNKIIQKQRGTVIMSREFLNTAGVASLQDLFSNIFPIQIEDSYFDSILYHCFSPLFEEIEDGIIAPRYFLDVKWLDQNTPQIVGAHKV